MRMKRFSKKWVGKKIVAVKKDGTVIRGRVVKVSDKKIWVKRKTNRNKAHTSAIIPLVLYDLLAIGGGPYGYGGGYPYGAYGGYGYPGYPGYPGNYGYGYPGWFY